ncbi:zincin-like metallopeptidase domain-containing protein, partial [Tepidicaulis sp. LMO-SS28]|uniref:zincin-like metallopeptidase domain-containing protein n=1 Tax=Tepidicaulis sp. LMO-SS28 TaxID=3447455 RepID=UPI003EE38213
MSKAPRKNWRQSVVEELVKHIEAGTAPWQKPWDPDLIRDRPHNPVSGIAYKGINTLWLEMQPHEDPRWMTYRQALGQDAQVRKGEKGTQVEYWKWSERRQKVNEAGRPITDADGKPIYETYRLQRPKVFYATVFNAEQIDGLEPYKAPELTFEPVKEAEKVLAGGGVPIHHDQTDRAFYAINLDEIHLPPQTAFNGQYDYYATALHELGHATGHKNRLAREFGVFGSETYAREELRAEMASYMISTELGLGHYPERHAAYVGSWLKAIEDDPLVLFRAARDAEAIRSWVMEPEKRLSLELAHKKEPEQTQAKELEQQEEQRMEAGQAETAKKRIYLDVPYEEKEAAKKRGARWDRKVKSWFVREGADLEAVSKWMPKEGETKAPKAQLAPQEEFAEALEAHGLKLKGAPQMDGKWHRVEVEGDRKGQLSGSYRGFLDGRPAGQIMNYKTGEKA